MSSYSALCYLSLITISVSNYCLISAINVSQGNVATRLSCGGTVSSLDIRRNLRWLPVSHRINFKLCLLTWKTIHTARPPYLSELITHYLPLRALRSSNTNFLARPTGITSNFTSRPFSVSTPSTWNSLPTHVRSLDKFSTFKRHLKAHLFQSAFAA